MEIVPYKFNQTPNKSQGTGKKPLGILWHETVGPTAKSAMDWNMHTGPDVGVQRGQIGSAYYYIDRDGTIYSFVGEDDYVAWHAGTSYWRGYRDLDVNEVLIGVELTGWNDGTPITDAMYEAAAWLAGALSKKHGFTLERGDHPKHREVALPVGRKTDPLGANIDKILTMAKQQLAPTPAAVATPIKGWAVVKPDLGENLNVRSGPGTDSKVVDTLPPSSRVWVYKTQGFGNLPWVTCVYTVGGTRNRGWVHIGYLVQP